jgi:predicted secreted protein
LLLLAGVPAAAADLSETNVLHRAAAGPDDAPATVLHISATAERQLRQDRLTIDLLAEARGEDAERAQADLNRLMAGAVARAKAIPSVHTETLGYSASQIANRDATLVQWRAVQTLRLTATDGGESGLDALRLAGQLQHSGLALVSMRTDVAPGKVKDLKEEIAAEALKLLQAKAQSYAKALGLVFVGFSSIHVGDGPGPTGPRLMAAGGVVSSATAPAAEPGDAVVQVTADGDAMLEPMSKDGKK